jgi:hypothetical protein
MQRRPHGSPLEPRRPQRLKRFLVQLYNPPNALCRKAPMRWPPPAKACAASRRSNGEGGLSWNQARQRWVGRVSLGYNADGKRRIGTVSARTKTEAKNKLRALLRDHDDGLPTQRAYTVGDAIETWLVQGLVGRDPNTVANRTSLPRTHVIPGLGKSAASRS